MSKQYQPFSRLISELERLTKQRETGYLLIATNTNKAGRILLDNGHIVAALYNHQQGEAALGAMQEIEQVRAGFRPGQFDAIEEQKLAAPTAKTLRRLAGYLPNEESNAADAKKRIFALTDEHRNTIQSALVDLLGPMGDIICDEIFERYTTLEKVIKMASLEINSPEDQEMFMGKMKILLEKEEEALKKPHTRALSPTVNLNESATSHFNPALA